MNKKRENILFILIFIVLALVLTAPGWLETALNSIPERFNKDAIVCLSEEKITDLSLLEDPRGAMFNVETPGPANNKYEPAVVNANYFVVEFRLNEIVVESRYETVGKSLPSTLTYDRGCIWLP